MNFEEKLDWVKSSRMRLIATVVTTGLGFVSIYSYGFIRNIPQELHVFVDARALTSIVLDLTWSAFVALIVGRLFVVTLWVASDLKAVFPVLFPAETRRRFHRKLLRRLRLHILHHQLRIEILFVFLLYIYQLFEGAGPFEYFWTISILFLCTTNFFRQDLIMFLAKGGDRKQRSVIKKQNLKVTKRNSNIVTLMILVLCSFLLLGLGQARFTKMVRDTVLLEVEGNEILGSVLVATSTGLIISRGYLPNLPNADHQIYFQVIPYGRLDNLTSGCKDLSVAGWRNCP